MKARLTNLSSGRRLAWTEVSVPYSLLQEKEATFLTDHGIRLRAVRGASRGEHSTFYRVHAPFDGHQVIEGTFLDDKAHDVPVNPIIFSDWVTDDIQALIPSWVVRMGGEDYRMTSPSITMVEGDSAHVKYHVKGRLDGAASGFVGQFWVTIFHLQDVADVEGCLTWSDRGTSEVGIEIEAIGLESGEYIALDFAVRNNHNGPHRLGDKWTWVLSGPIGFGDATSYPVEGRMLCVKQESGFNEAMAVDTENIAVDDVDTDRDYYNERIQSLWAAYEAPVQGCMIDQEWNSRWLSHKWVPRHQHNPNPQRNEDTGTWADAVAFHQKLMSQYRVPAPLSNGVPRNSMYEDRRHILYKNPSQTGSQPDFGSTKGSMAISLGDPRWIWHAGFQLQSEMFRGYMHFENDASMLLYENHPQWITWSGGTHWRQNPHDTLGKESEWGNHRSTGHHGTDDQHRSWNLFCAFLALKDSAMYMALLEHHIVTDQAMQKDRLGSSRSVGRLFLAWGHGLLITDGEWYTRLKAVADEKKAAVEKNGMMNIPGVGPVQIIAASGPDPSTGVHDGNGNYLPTWSVWMNSLGVVGLYAMWKVTGDPSYLDLVKRVSKSIIDWGIFKEGGSHQICYSVWYPWGEGSWGQPITTQGGSYKTSYDLPEHHSVSIGLPGWTVPAVLIWLELHSSEMDETTKKAREIRKERTGNAEAKKWEDAEWWACVEKVVQ